MSKQVIESTIVMVSATISLLFSWFPGGGYPLGQIDKAISIAAGLVAIVVGLATLYNYARKWTREGKVDYVLIFLVSIAFVIALTIVTAIVLI